MASSSSTTAPAGDPLMQGLSPAAAAAANGSANGSAGISSAYKSMPGSPLPLTSNTPSSGPPPGIKVKIKRTSSTDSRSSGGSSGGGSGGKAAELHEIVPASPPIQNGNSTTTKKCKKDKLKLNVTNADVLLTSNQLLSDKVGSLSSSIDSPSTTVSSGSSAASSPVCSTTEQPFSSKYGPECGGVLKRHLLSQSSEPPSKKAKANRNNDDQKTMNGNVVNGGASSKEDVDEGIAIPSSSNEASTMTDPDCLGPCQPGTAVKLQGIVLQENDKGLLVLNVTWRGKSFMGTMIDFNRVSEDHKWGPPKDPSMHKRKRGRGGRSRTPPVKISLKKGKSVAGKGSSNGTQTTPPSPLAATPKIESSPRVQRLPRVNYDESDEQPQHEDEFLKGYVERNGQKNKDDLRKSPTSNYIECPKPGCSKKFPMLEALKYHITALHKEEDNSVKKAKKSPVKKPKKEPIEDDKPTDLSTMVNGHSKGPAAANKPPPPPPTTTAMKPAPAIQGVNYLSSSINPSTPPKAHSQPHPAHPPPLIHNGVYKDLALNSKPVATPQKVAGPASPAYSDISDEETPTQPPPQPPVATAARLPQSTASQSFFNNQAAAAAAAAASRNIRPPMERKTDGSGPTTQTIGPPPQHLPPDLHGGSLMFPPGLPGPNSNPLLNQAYMSAMMAAAQAAGQRFPGPLPFGGAKGALDVMAQHANNFLATSKLQELQEKVSSTKKPVSSSSSPSLGTPNRSATPPRTTNSQHQQQSMAGLLGLGRPPPNSPSLRHEHNHTHLHLGFPGASGATDLSSASSPSNGPTPASSAPARSSSSMPPVAHAPPPSPHASLLQGLFTHPPLPPGFRLPSNFPHPPK